jgi:hypothetical protein
MNYICFYRVSNDIKIKPLDYFCVAQADSWSNWSLYLKKYSDCFFVKEKKVFKKIALSLLSNHFNSKTKTNIEYQNVYVMLVLIDK